jgi:hypothetical protein
MCQKKIIKRNKTVKKEYVCACIEYDKLMDVEKYELIITYIKYKGGYCTKKNTIRVVREMGVVDVVIIK